MKNSGVEMKCALVLFAISSAVYAENLRERSSIDHIHPRLEKPHIIMIMADDIGWNDVSFHGSDQIPTPNIDALAMNGIILNRYYTQQSCTPSRAAYLTGRYPLRDGLQGLPLKPGQALGIPLETPLLPEQLRKLGYTTRLVGKWHVGYYTVDHTPTRRGFDTFFGFYSGYIGYYNHTITQDDYKGYDVHRNTSRAEYRRKYFTDLITEEVETIIRQHDVSEPLYLQVSQLAPHSGELEELLEVHNMTEVNKTFGYIEDINRRKYAGMVSRLDHSVGRIMQALKKAGMLENSIVIFTSDNGAPTETRRKNYGSNYPFRGLKLSLFDGGVRVATCIYSPLLNNVSRVSNELMHITDWMPTLYSAAGGNVDDLGEIDGVNQWPALKEGAKSPRDSVLLNVDELLNISGAVSGKYKLLKGDHVINTHFSGDSGIGDGYPPYDATSVVESDAGCAIAGISHHAASPEQIIEIRNKAKISCPPHNEYVNCTETCLFDMSKDPCETVDISDQDPETVKAMEDYIASYHSFLIPQIDLYFDPASIPERFGGIWMPWIENSQ